MVVISVVPRVQAGFVEVTCQLDMACTSSNYSPSPVDRIWGIWASYYNIPRAIFYLLKVDYSLTPASSNASMSELLGQCILGSRAFPIGESGRLSK